MATPLVPDDRDRRTAGSPVAPDLPAASDLLHDAARHWGLVLASGVLAVVVGLLALLVPGPTLVFIGVLFGVSLVVTGASAIARGVSGEGTAGAQTLSVLVGFAAVVGGLFCFVRPGAGLLAVVLAVAFWFVLVGVGDLTHAMDDPRHRWSRGLLGAVGIVAGIVLLVDPVIGLSTLALLAGLGFVVRGVVEIALALQLRRLDREGSAT